MIEQAGMLNFNKVSKFSIYERNEPESILDF